MDRDRPVWKEGYYPAPWRRGKGARGSCGGKPQEVGRHCIWRGFEAEAEFNKVAWKITPNFFLNSGNEKSPQIFSTVKISQMLGEGVLKYKVEASWAAGDSEPGTGVVTFCQRGGRSRGGSRGLEIALTPVASRGGTASGPDSGVRAAGLGGSRSAWRAAPRAGHRSRRSKYHTREGRLNRCSPRGA